MKVLHPLFLIPASLAGFLFGAVLSPSKKRHGSLSRPLPDVSVTAWENFVSTMAIAPKGHVSLRGKLGVFEMDPKRLKDVGLMKSVSKGVRGEVVGVWIGEWLPPLSESVFLGSMPLQYAAFVRSVKAAAAAPKVSGNIGRVVDGTKCSLSGLLGVCHAAGEGGVESWVADPLIRKRFPGTTERFERTNGIF